MRIPFQTSVPITCIALLRWQPPKVWGQLLANSHDKFPRRLSTGTYDSAFLWMEVKPMVQELSSSKEKIVLCFDDSIEERLYTGESPLICWHYDQVFNTNVKGVNFLSTLVDVGGQTTGCR